MATDVNRLGKHLLAMRKAVEDPDSVYTSTNSSKGALLVESQTLFTYLARESTSLDSARCAVIKDDMFGKRTNQTRKRCWEVLRSRYFPTGGDSVRFHPIITLFRSHASKNMRQGVLYYHFATSDLFSYEATVGFVYDRFSRGLVNIAPRNVREFLTAKERSHPEASTWTPQTRQSLVSHYLSALRDFGVLEGKTRKKIRKPIIDENLFLYIATVLRDCGKSARDTLASDDFKLFLLSPPEVEARFMEAHRNRRIRFQKSGPIISLQLPWETVLEYIQTFGR